MIGLREERVVKDVISGDDEPVARWSTHGPRDRARDARAGAIFGSKKLKRPLPRHMFKFRFRQANPRQVSPARARCPPSAKDVTRQMLTAGDASSERKLLDQAEGGKKEDAGSSERWKYPAGSFHPAH